MNPYHTNQPFLGPVPTSRYSVPSVGGAQKITLSIYPKQSHNNNHIGAYIRSMRYNNLKQRIKGWEKVREPTGNGSDAIFVKY
jgi:hypothetical protein